MVASSGDVYYVYDQLRGRVPWDGVQPRALAEDARLREELYPYGRIAETPKGTFVDYDKILVERAAMAASHITVLRLPKVYGPGDPAPIFGAVVRRMLRGEPVVVGERVARWRWTHGYVENVAHAIGLAATSGARGVYNVGEADPPPLVDRLRAIAVGEVEVVPDERVPAELRIPIANPIDLVFDTTRIRLELGYRELVDSAPGYARTVAAMRADAMD